MKFIAIFLAASALAAPSFAKDVKQADFEARYIKNMMKNDANSDSKLDKAEFAAARKNMDADKAAKAFARLDTDSDGFLTAAELTSTAQQRFKKLDANADGTLTDEERSKE